MINLPKPRVVVKKVSEKGATVLVQNVRLAFVKIATPGKNEDKEDGTIKYEYGVNILFPKNLNVHKEIMKAAGDAAKMSTWLSSEPRQKGKNTLPSEKEEAYKISQTIDEERGIIKDGDNICPKGETTPFDGFAGNYTVYIKATAEEQPDGTFKPKKPLQLVRADKSEIARHQIADEIYSGCWADVTFFLAPYKFKGKCGVTKLLNGIMKLADDVKFGAVDAFEDRSDVMTSSGESEAEPETY